MHPPAHTGSVKLESFQGAVRYGSLSMSWIVGTRGFDRRMRKVTCRAVTQAVGLSVRTVDVCT
jgi:hypothetical protein